MRKFRQAVRVYIVANLRNSQVMTPNMRILPVVTANM